MKRRRRFARLGRFAADVVTHTSIVTMVIVLVILWLGFSAGLYFAEQGAEGAIFTSYGQALYGGRPLRERLEWLSASALGAEGL